MFKLRDYQQDAVDACLAHIKKTLATCVLNLATGAGKSLIIAEIAKQISAASGKKVLCLAPSKELVEQNFAKYLSYGAPASFWSASVGQKSTAFDVVFGTPLSVLNGVDSFRSGFAAIIIDEAHNISPTIRQIIEQMRDGNENIRVIALTATPFRTGTGYIYKFGIYNNQVSRDKTTDPYFDKLVCQVTTAELLSKGYLTPPVFADHVGGYDADKLKLNRRNQFDASDIAETFEGKGRLTSKIVADVVDKADHNYGVMFFAASVKHAQEIAESLPPAITAVVTGQTKKAEREQIISDFQSGSLHYLVSVSTLTTGFDAPNVGTIALLRATESPGLLLQIIGRGMRLLDGKESFLVLDYAKNLERHGLSSENLEPEIEAVTRTRRESLKIDVTCPECGHINSYSFDRSVGKNKQLDENGYVIDAFAQRMLSVDGKPVPGHHGQRCAGERITRLGVEQCKFRFASKECDDCGAENSLSSRNCCECDAELADPNKKLIIKQIKELARGQWRVAAVKSMRANASKKSVKVSFITENGVIPVFFAIRSDYIWAQKQAVAKLAALGVDVNADDIIAAINSTQSPASITYRKNDNGYYSLK